MMIHNKEYMRSIFNKISLILLISLIFVVTSCSKKEVKKNLNHDDVVIAYSKTDFATFVEEYKDNDSIKYDCSVKAYDINDESSDYLFIYFFDDIDDAKDYYKEAKSKIGFIWVFGLIFGERLKVKYEIYDYMVLEYSNNTSKEMIKIYKDILFE